MLQYSIEYIAAGGNRHPTAADWDAESGLLAYGADKNIAIWNPLVMFTAIVRIRGSQY